MKNSELTKIAYELGTKVASEMLSKEAVSNPWIQQALERSIADSFNHQGRVGNFMYNLKPSLQQRVEPLFSKAFKNVTNSVNPLENMLESSSGSSVLNVLKQLLK